MGKSLVSCFFETQCIMHFASDSALILQQLTYMTVPKGRGTSEIPHPHAAHLPYLPELRQ